jgi:hypothetical protein
LQVRTEDSQQLIENPKQHKAMVSRPERRQPAPASSYVDLPVVLSSSSEDSDGYADDEVHACLLAAHTHFRPCCLPLTAPWCGSTLRMQECFRENLVGLAQPKTQTMRPEWCIATIKQHTRLFQKGWWFRVSCGGQGNIKTIGWGRYLAVDQVQLGCLTAVDCMREGCPGMAVTIFLNRFLLRKAVDHKDAYIRASGKRVPARLAKPAITHATFAWRFQFEFVPCI